MQLHLPHQLVDLLERMAFILRRQEERTQVESVVIGRIRLGVIRRGQRRHLEPIDCVEVEKALDLRGDLVGFHLRLPLMRQSLEGAVRAEFQNLAADAEGR